MTVASVFGVTSGRRINGISIVSGSGSGKRKGTKTRSLDDNKLCIVGMVQGMVLLNNGNPFYQQVWYWAYCNWLSAAVLFHVQGQCERFYIILILVLFSHLLKCSVNM